MFLRHTVIPSVGSVAALAGLPLSSLLFSRRTLHSSGDDGGGSSSTESSSESSTDISTTVLSEEESRQGGPPQPPFGWTLDVVAGTGRFIMKKNVTPIGSTPRSATTSSGDGDEDDASTGGVVFLQCNSDFGGRFREGPSGSSVEQAHRIGIQPLPKFSKVRPMDIHPEHCCTFSALVFPPDHKIPAQLQNSSILKKPPLALEALISCKGSVMVIDSLLFHRSEATLDAVLDVDSPKAAGVTALRYQYQGPTLHQRRLAEEAIFQYQSPSKLPIYLDAHYQRYEAHPIYGEAGHTRHYKYGHVPVHTVEPELYDRLYLYLESLGVDDQLASFVRRYANHNQMVQRSEWTEAAMSIFKRKKQK